MIEEKRCQICDTVLLKLGFSDRICPACLLRLGFSDDVGGKHAFEDERRNQEESR